jgi:protoporphyrinogen oxidase
MTNVREFVVLGAGLSGLAAARAIEGRGRDCIVLERAPTAGGLTRTIAVGDFCFDYTGHFLHLAHFPAPSAIPHAGLNDQDWQTIERRSACFVSGTLVPAPIQYHLGHLPAAEREQCIASYEQRPRAGASGPETFRDYVVGGFGQRLADLFLIPQNEKTMAIPLERLSRDAVRRFFPPPDDARIRMGMDQATREPAGYNARFWYPRRGGIETLVRGFATGLHSVATGQDVTAIDLARRRLRTRAGAEFGWRRALLTSMPLRQLCIASGDEELGAAAAQLSNSATISFNIGMVGELPAQFAGLHWIYVPDRDLPFYRVGFYSEISEGTVARGCSSMYVEVGVPGHELPQVDIAGDLQPRVLHALAALGWLELPQVTALAVHTIDCAYVHHTPQRDALVAQILSRLEKHDVFPIGRYGQWDYTSMEDSIRSGLDTGDRLAR